MYAIVQCLAILTFYKARMQSDARASKEVNSKTKSIEVIEVLE